MKRKILISGTACLAAILGFYLLLLVWEARTVHDVSAMLNRLETLRLGDPVERFDQALRGCQLERMRSEHACRVVAGAFHPSWPWTLVGELAPENYVRALELAGRAGLRYWDFSATASAPNGRIERVSVRLFVHGRYELLGAVWTLTNDIPTIFQDRAAPGTEERRTFMHWFHVTSLPGGEGFSINATPASTESELQARRINRGCLFSSSGCDGLCELLPDAVPVLKERSRNWGGGTGAPKSKCELN